MHVYLWLETVKRKPLRWIGPAGFCLVGLLKSLLGIGGDGPPDAGVGYVNGAKEVGGGRGGDAPEKGAPLPHAQRTVWAQLTPRLLLGVGPCRTIRTPEKK